MVTNRQVTAPFSKFICLEGKQIVRLYLLQVYTKPISRPLFFKQFCIFVDETYFIKERF